MLTLTLRNLERDGLVSRTVTPSIPPRVDYALTELGRSLLKPDLRPRRMGDRQCRGDPRGAGALRRRAGQGAGRLVIRESDRANGCPAALLRGDKALTA